MPTRSTEQTARGGPAHSPRPLARKTRQRQVIMEALRGLRSHPTADEVHQLVRRRLPRISLGTVYRNLDALSRAGEIQALRLGCAQRRFDGDISHHHHVRCTGCGRVADMPMTPVRALERARGAADFEVTGYCLEFVGVCKACQRRGPRPQAPRATRTARGAPKDNR